MFCGLHGTVGCTGGFGRGRALDQSARNGSFVGVGVIAAHLAFALVTDASHPLPGAL